MVMNTQIIDGLLKNCKTREDIFGEGGLIKQFTKAVLERVLQAEITEHLGYEKHAAVGRNSGNSRNGSHAKTLKGDFGETEIIVPRDRAGLFTPQIIPKGQTRFAEFDDKILALYARGLST